MEFLPIELYNNIFEYIIKDQIVTVQEIDDLIKLSLVCKKWKELVECMVTSIRIFQTFKGNQNIIKTIKSLNHLTNQNIQNNNQNNQNNQKNNQNNYLPILCRLKVIQLCFGLNDDNIKNITPMLCSYKFISTINLSKNNLGSNSIKSLKPLIVNNNNGEGIGKGLKLVLAGNNIGVQGARRLSKYLSSRLCNLVELDISNNKLNDNGTKMLMMALVNNQSLESINLSGNNIGKDSVVYLKEVFKYNQKIKIMDLSFNWIQDGSYQLLHFLFYNRLRRNQVSLNLNYNKIQEIGIQQINKLFVELSLILTYGIVPASLEAGQNMGGGGETYTRMSHQPKNDFSNSNYYNNYRGDSSCFPPIFPIDRLDINGNDCEMDTTKAVYSNLDTLRTQYNHMLLKVATN
ncbi:hypothetical protein DFA_04799 [Cavenderia fasciculata]|uniref:F-box domain-containing protein n=1 Tax=Cavenderia fasciculata TaxID=261658 RepID=F4PNZ0_CACFS|nr:uncharacterized protein DFA_04799 [Cavenderia fasciculata]EGG22669.1 hypothetical protein DFA_04799 [Cavenderia fasciculata]|eukprot:XP_004360520.1 hypothetical protein DFA_04799 [Cavenderia fasciculata]